jgi:predicted Kef-type K+ transport protein
MRKIYLTIIKALGVVALSMLVVSGILYVGGNHTNAGIAMGICLSVSGVVLMMYSLR